MAHNILLHIASLVLFNIASGHAINYAIVGGGPAGYVVAERLSRNSSVNIVLFETGPDASSDPLVEVPSRYFFDQKYIYNYNVTSSSTDPYVQGVSTNIWQGKALGGGTAVNAQIYCRGASSVFDEWANISGNAGLAWNSLLQDFKANTAYEGGPANYTQPVDTSVFGNGPLAVSGSRELYSFDEPLASQVHSSLGLNQIDTVDGQGIGWTYGLDTITNDNNRTRSFAPNSYGALMNGRGNVRIVPNTQVTRIGFKKGTAQYVAFTNDTTGKTQRLQADEIIVTAGSINAVQLLLLSGVGPQSDLQAMKIPVVANISAVGANLIDHFYSVVEYKAAPGVETTWQWSYNKTEVAEANSEYRKDGDGPLGEDNVGIMAFQRLSDSIFQSAKSSYYLNMPKDRPNMAYLSATTPFLFNSPNETIVAGFSAVVQPESRGTVKLASTDPTDAPLVNFNFFGTPGDKAAIMAGYKNLRQLFGSKALKSYVVEEIYPGPQVTSDSQVFEAIKNSINSWHHAVGTTALGTVLDSNWRVKGLKGLRVVGASAMPTIPTCPIQAAVYALSHRAAEDIYQADMGRN